MFGAIAGDVIGSPYEGNSIKTTKFPLFEAHSCFTDDTVMTIAVANAILERQEYGISLQTFGRKYPRAGYGHSFYEWIFQSDIKPYNSWGNGSAMRVSPIGFAFDTIDDVLAEAQRSAEVSHNHPEGIKGAQATALTIFLARMKESKTQIRQEISSRFGYDLTRTVNKVRLNYTFDVSCQGSVPESIIAFLDSNDYEDSIRNAISLGGDSDTIACIAGGIAQAFYQTIPNEIVLGVQKRLPEEFLQVLARFNQRYNC